MTIFFLDVLIVQVNDSQLNMTEALGVDSDVFINGTWSPEHPVPARYQNKKVPLFGVAPAESPDKKGVTESPSNKRNNNPITKVIAPLPTVKTDVVGRNDSTVSDLIAQVLLKQQELINKLMPNAAVGVPQMNEALKTSIDVKQNTMEPVENSSGSPVLTSLNNLNEESETEESESEEIDANATNSTFFAVLLKQKPVEPTTNTALKRDKETVSNTRPNSTQPSRELLDSLLNLPPSLLDQAAKSVNSGQITPEALASLLKLRPDLLGDAASTIDTKQITPDVIRSLLKLRMTFMESGGSPQAFDQFARGSPEDLVKLMKVMSPGEDSTKAKGTKTKSAKNGKSKKKAQSETASEDSSVASLSLLGDVTSETEVKPTTKPAILPNLLTLMRPHLFDLIGLDSSAVSEQETKAATRPNQHRLRNQHDPDRVKSQRFGIWKQPKKCRRHPPRYPNYPQSFPQHVPYVQHPRFRRPSQPKKSKSNRCIFTISKTLD